MGEQGDGQHKFHRPARVSQASVEEHEHEVPNAGEGALGPVWLHGCQYVCQVSWNLFDVPGKQAAHLVVSSPFRSIFGENALANLSIEKPVDDPDSKVTGHIRIRAKSQVSCIDSQSSAGVANHIILPQGMALSLGDKISSSQKQSVQAT